jgi:hypothetical protein
LCCESLKKKSSLLLRLVDFQTHGEGEGRRWSAAAACKNSPIDRQCVPLILTGLKQTPRLMLEVVHPPSTMDTPSSAAAAAPPPPTSASPTAPQSATLIVSGKRARRKVNKSADYLYNAPQNRATKPRLTLPIVPSSTANDDTDMDVDAEVTPRQKHTPIANGNGSPSASAITRKRKKSAGISHDRDQQVAEATAKRARLQQRKAELEAYLLRLQVALAVEKNGAGAVPSGGKAEMKSEKAHASVSAVRRKSFTNSKKKETKAPVVPIVDDDALQPSLKACIRIIDDLLHNQYGDVFAAPVDFVALNLPTYPDVVKTPMDLGTVRNRLVTNHYRGLSDFISDVHLIWDNAKLFNAPQSFVHGATLEMERIWNRKRENLKRERRRSLQSPMVREQAEHTSHSMLSAPNTNDVIRPLTFVEKSKLRADIVKVPANHFQKMIDIVGQSIVHGAAATELELDLEKMDPQMLRKLQKFVGSVVPKTASRVRPSVTGTPTRRLSNSMSTVATAVLASESDSDASSSSGLDSESSDDEMVPPMGLPPMNPVPAPVPAAVDAAPAVEEVNTDAWSNLSTEEQNQATADAADEKAKDPLWHNYQTMSVEQAQREQQRRHEDDLRRQEQDRLAAERLRLDEIARVNREEAERRRAEQIAEADRNRQTKLQEEREAERRKLEADDVDEQPDASLGFLSIFNS